ncbi:hypothetical protein AYI70_g12405 [Smittium culicis]|uniref:Uncharacterized protein n=1 Tax=Smittium culicis TaxID=133412 RepID=A0A1R1WXL8_9FUNG|nr:hypothetical protein AYI70_g12405 [Smittium culicis]
MGIGKLFLCFVSLYAINLSSKTKLNLSRLLKAYSENALSNLNSVSVLASCNSTKTIIDLDCYLLGCVDINSHLKSKKNKRSNQNNSVHDADSNIQNDIIIKEDYLNTTLKLGSQSKELVLHVDTNRKPAINVYTNLYFTTIEEVCDYYSEGRHAYKMSLS